MKKMKNIRRIANSLGCLCLLLAYSAAQSSAEGFISREERPQWGERYENFSNYDMRKYPETLYDRYGGSESGSGATSGWVDPTWHGPADPVTFDQFGNFLLPGGDIYNMTWDMSDVGATDFYDDNRARIFNNLMISSDEFSDWQTKFMIGTNLRAQFTPSTLRKASFNGIRWDASNRKNSFSIIASAGNQASSHQDRVSNKGLYKNVLGGHWQSVLGDVLTLGGTFVVENRGTQSYSNFDISGGDRGLLNRDIERYMYVIITSDSPEDESISARVYDVQPVIDGNKVNLPTRVVQIPDVINMKKFSDNEFQDGYLFNTTDYAYIARPIEDYMYSNGSWFLSLMGGGGSTSVGNYTQLFNKADISKQVGYVNILNPDNPADPTDRMFLAEKTSGYYEARGTDVIIYEVLVPAGARKVEFLCSVSNDYCIDVVAALPTMQQTEKGGDFNDNPTGPDWESGTWSVYYDEKHCAKAPGRVTDGSNNETVKVTYDRLTGINVYGLNMELNWRGLFVRGEINEYNALRAYPIHGSFSGEDKNIESARAWFLNVEKDFGNWSVGGEIFDYPNDYMQYWSGDLVDDNDDGDHRTGWGQRKYENYNQQSTGWEYPGLNFDHDGTPQVSNTNSWQHVDTYFSGEPYIGYYFDEVAFGDDFNHNGIIDERENDDKIDLPYDRDSSGQHYFVKLYPFRFTNMTIGHYDIEQEELGGRNLTSYLKFEHMKRVGIFDYALMHRTERVQDNYKSDAYYRQYFGGPFLIGYNTWDGSDSYYEWSGRFNNFAYRNSWVYSTFLKTKTTLFESLNLHNNVKHDLISRKGDLQLEGSENYQTMQLPQDISTTAFVHKIDYAYRIADFRLIPDIYWRGIRLLKEKRIREFSIIPQFKFVNFYTTKNFHLRDGDNHIYNYYPVLRFDYQVAPNTKLRAAFQGLPGLEEAYRNRERPLEEEDRRRMFVGFETTTVYQGFNMLVTTGMRRDKRTYVEPMGRRETGNTEYFVTLRVESNR